MLHFQWQQDHVQENQAGWNGKWAGDHVGYPTG